MPEMPHRQIELDQTMRNVLSQEQLFGIEPRSEADAFIRLTTIAVENVHPNTTVAIRLKGISGREVAYPDRKILLNEKRRV